MTTGFIIIIPVFIGIGKDKFVYLVRKTGIELNRFAVVPCYN